MHISSSYAKILGETNFHTREFPQSRSKRRRRERERKRERPKVGYNNGQLPIVNATSGGARKPPGPMDMRRSVWSEPPRKNHQFTETIVHSKTLKYILPTQVSSPNKYCITNYM